MGDIIARLSLHRKAVAIELLYGVSAKQPCLQRCHNLFRQSANPALLPSRPSNRTLATDLRHQYALAGPGYRGTMTRFRIEMVLPCRIPLPSLFL